MKTLELRPIPLESYIGISEKSLDDITIMLSALLSSEMSLYVKTRKFHWNIADENFMELHTLFETQYKQLEQAIDNVADRMSSFGGKTIGVMQEFAKRSSIREVSGKYASSQELVKELIKNHERIVVQLLKNIDECMDKFKDIDTADFLTGLLQEHETIKWTLKKYVN